MPLYPSGLAFAENSSLSRALYWGHREDTHRELMAELRNLAEHITRLTTENCNLRDEIEELKRRVELPIFTID